MRIVLLSIFALSPSISLANVDSTRLQMELDYLLSGSQETKVEKNEMSDQYKEQTPPEIEKLKRLELSRLKNKNTDILPLESEFDRVKVQYSAPQRAEDKSKSYIESNKEPVRINGLIPKGIVSED